MNRNIFYLSTVLLSSLLLSCGNRQDASQQAPPPAASVTSHTVARQHVTGTDSYPGTIVPLQEVELRPQVAGYITNIYVRDGQKVTKGQKLYEIDQNKYQAGLQQARAQLQSAQANLERVRKDVERYERLLERDAIARQQVDNARAELQSAEAQVSVARAQIASASTDLGYASISAPFAGTVGISQVRIGTQVSPGQPLLNTLSADDPIAVDFVINEQEIPRFSRLQTGTQPDSLFMIRLSDGRTYPSPAKLVAIDRAVGRQTGTITVRLQLPNPERHLIAGMTVTVSVLNQDIGEQVVIPFRAVTEQLGEFYVYQIQADSVIQQNVLLGTRFGANIVVREGLHEGDQIVVEGTQRLRQGAKIQVGTAPPTQGQPQASK